MRLTVQYLLEHLLTIPEGDRREAPVFTDLGGDAPPVLIKDFIVTDGGTVILLNQDRDL